jgi:hypothetical protein
VIFRLTCLIWRKDAGGERKFSQLFYFPLEFRRVEDEFSGIFEYVTLTFYGLVSVLRYDASRSGE